MTSFGEPEECRVTHTCFILAYERTTLRMKLLLVMICAVVDND